MSSTGTVAEIKSRLPVTEIVGETVQLKRAGTTWKGLCPFHAEKTPSFTVSPERESWHCFGCGEHGDIFTFVMKRDGLDFREALNRLAEKAGVQAEAKWVIAQCEYGYTSDLSLESMMDDDVLVAWAHGGADLTREHGFPLRLVVPKRYAWKSAKWLTGLEFQSKNVRGFWEVRGYHIHAEPFAEERYSYQEGPGAELQA